MAGEAALAERTVAVELACAAGSQICLAFEPDTSPAP